GDQPIGRSQGVSRHGPNALEGHTALRLSGAEERGFPVHLPRLFRGSYRGTDLPRTPDEDVGPPILVVRRQGPPRHVADQVAFLQRAGQRATIFSGGLPQNESALLAVGHEGSVTDEGPRTVQALWPLARIPSQVVEREHQDGVVSRAGHGYMLATGSDGEH